uniref:Dickkopf WNT signaling pathway inhibitor 3a n=1 Tax=Poecilia latipinna TaxID=48699 RepID=A0A3B3TR40_9TELE
MMRYILTLLALPAVCNGILPEIVESGINHIVEGPSELDRILVQEDPLQKPEDAFPQVGSWLHLSVSILLSNIHLLFIFSLQGCVTNDDCGKGKYCLSDTHRSKCKPCKDTDVSCTKDDECCGDQMCVWGQCSKNATKGEAGSTCQVQNDCQPDLCCAIHKALLFPVCSVKPIERERCFDISNNLMELLSWDMQDNKPRKHCPCAGELQCQHLGRGSMCLKAEDSSEEDLTDSLYSEIDYIL